MVRRWKDGDDDEYRECPTVMTPLMIAANVGHVAVVAQLLSAGASTDLVDEHGNTAKQIAELSRSRNGDRVDDIVKLFEQ